MIKTYKINQCYRLLISLIFIYILLAYPDISINASREGFRLSFISVLPAIFPFMVISKYLIYSGLAVKISNKTDFIFNKFLKIPFGASFAFLIGIISGYPVGAYTLANLAKNKIITRENASQMMGFCNNASPVFIIGTVGISILRDEKLGYILYLIHLISAIIIAFLKRNRYAPQITNKIYFKSVKSPFTTAVSDSVSASAAIIGYIVFFCVISELLLKLMPINKVFSGLICGVMEISSGIKILSELNISPQLKISLISSILGFSGLSVFFQAAGGACEAGITMDEYLKSKIIFSILSFIISYLVFGIIL